jgi:hypothetical protein
MEVCLRDYASEFTIARMILAAVDINKDNNQIAHAVDAITFPFLPELTRRRGPSTSRDPSVIVEIACILEARQRVSQP